MTIQQEAYEKIMKLPENGIKLIIALADEISRKNSVQMSDDDVIEENRKIYQEMLEMKKKSKYPKNFDYKKVMEEAVNEKYANPD